MTRTFFQGGGGRSLVGILAGAAIGLGLVTGAAGQVPAATGPDVIADVTGSGRVAPEGGSSSGAEGRTEPGQGGDVTRPEARPEEAPQARPEEVPEARPQEAPRAREESAGESGEGQQAGTREGDDRGGAERDAAAGEETPRQDDGAQEAATTAPTTTESQTASPAATEPSAATTTTTAGPTTPTSTTPAPTVAGEDARADEGKAAAATPAAAPEKARFIVGSWAGAYGEAQRKAVIDPVQRELDVVIERRAHGAGAVSLEGVDAVELSQEGLLAACGEGRVLALADWPREGISDAGAGTEQGSDYLVDTGEGCGLPSFAWSSMLIVDPAGMRELAGRRYREPGRIADFLDVKRYPGKRAVMREPRRLMEMVLLADGVTRETLYQVFATRAGEDRAFARLDELKADIIWVSGPREALAALDEGRASMAMTFSGRAFRRLIAGQLRPIWDGHIIEYGAWAVPTGTTRRGEAVRFIRAALKPERMAAQARIWPYGPMRRSAVTLARRHELLGTELDVFLPTSELRFEQGVVFDARFWAENGARIEKRFEDWLNGVPLGIRVPPPRKAPPAPLPPPPRLNSAG